MFNMILNFKVMKEITLETIDVLKNELFCIAIDAFYLKEHYKIQKGLNLPVEVRQKIWELLLSFKDKSAADTLQENNPIDFGHFTPIFSAHHIVALVENVNLLIENFHILTKHQLNTRYNIILQKIISMITIKSNSRVYVNYAHISNLELRASIDAYLKIKSRYEKILYPKKEIFFNILRSYAEKNGKWKNPSQAVKDVYSEVIIEFEKIDRDYIAEKSKKLEKIKQEVLEKIMESIEIISMYDEDNIKHFHARKRKNKLEIKLDRINQEILKFSKALDKGYPFLELGKEISFNNIMMDLSLINCLRNDEEIFNQVIEK